MSVGGTRRRGRDPFRKAGTVTAARKGPTRGTTGLSIRQRAELTQDIGLFVSPCWIYTMFQCFVTGTGTDVGKTVVAAGIASLCVDAGMRTSVVKPVQTGVADYDADIDVVARLVPALERSPHSMRTLMSFQYPASPHLAAELVGTEIDVDSLVGELDAIRQEGECDALIVEGAGGIMVPLTRSVSTLDFIKRLEMPVVVVAEAGLGTLNHTLLTVAAARSAGVGLAGVIVNMASESPDHVERDNVKTIAELSKTPVLAVIRDFRGTLAPDALSAEFARQRDLAGFVLESERRP